MAFIEIQRRCDDCEKTREALADLKRTVQNSLLDYENLYDKVRTNLAKLAKRDRKELEEVDEPDADPMARYRQMLAERKLQRRA